MAESFFRASKVERVHAERFAERETMRQVMFEYIEVVYNGTHRQSAVSSISPDAFEVDNAA